MHRIRTYVMLKYIMMFYSIRSLAPWRSCEVLVSRAAQTTLELLSEEARGQPLYACSVNSRNSRILIHGIVQNVVELLAALQENDLVQRKQDFDDWCKNEISSQDRIGKEFRINPWQSWLNGAMAATCALFCFVPTLLLARRSCSGS